MPGFFLSQEGLVSQTRPISHQGGDIIKAGGEGMKTRCGVSPSRVKG